MKTLTAIKREIKVGDKIRVINKLKDVDEVRNVTEVRKNGISTYSPTTRNLDGLGSNVKLKWQRARDTRVNDDDTIDFLLEKDSDKNIPWKVMSHHTHPEQYGIDTDYWLRIELLTK